jgi:hypothetical protein
MVSYEIQRTSTIPEAIKRLPPPKHPVLKDDAILFGIIHFKGTKHVLLD